MGQNHQKHTISFIIDVDSSGLRLDQYLSLTTTSYSRSQIIAAIRHGGIVVNGEQIKSSYKLKLGDKVTGIIEGNKTFNVLPERIEFSILFEDDYLILLSKPPGLVVHPGPGNPSATLVNGLVYHCQSIGDVGEQTRPGIVHRLDKDTSGIMVVAKNDTAHASLVDMFKKRSLNKEYLTIVRGYLKEKEGRLVAPIGRNPANRQKMAVRLKSGKHAATQYKVIREYEEGYSLVKVVIETGRTHQIRVHMAYLGNPVIGDIMYGPKKDLHLFKRQMLHASRLRFLHPVTNESVDMQAELWPDFKEVIDSFRVIAQ